MNNWAYWLDVAWRYTATVVGGVGIGYLFDRLVGTFPFGMIIGALFGNVAGFVALVRETNKSKDTEGK